MATNTSDPEFKEFIEELELKNIKKIEGLKPDSIYIPYSNEEGKISGIAAYPLCCMLFLAKSRLSEEISSEKSSSFEKKLGGHLVKKTQELIDYIINIQEKGVIDYSKQKELGKIYDKLASIKEKAKFLGQTGSFNTKEVFEAIKRFHFTQQGDYIAEYAYENSKDMIPPKLGDSTSHTKAVKFSAGKAIGISKTIGGASVMASIGYFHIGSEGRRTDDGLITEGSENGVSLGVALKAGVGPNPGDKPPKGPFPGSDLTIANANVEVTGKVGWKEYERYSALDAGPVKVQNQLTKGTKRSKSESKSWVIPRTINKLLYGADLKDQGVKDSTHFSNSEKEKRKITPEGLRDILGKNGIDICNNDSPLILITTSEEKRLKLHAAYEGYLNGKKLPRSLRISFPFSNTNKIIGGASGGLLTYGKAKAGFLLGLDKIHIRYFGDQIDIAKSELPAYKKLNEESPQFAFNNAREIIKTFDNEGGFADAYEVLKDIKEITAQINRDEVNTQEINNLFIKLHDVGLISTEDYENKKLRRHLTEDADQLKTYIMLAYSNFLAGAYDLVAKTKEKPDDELANLNKKYNGVASFVADCLWAGETPANTPPIEEYHRHVIAKVPGEDVNVYTAELSGSLQLGPKLDASTTDDGRAHTLNLATFAAKASYVSTPKHPNMIRTKDNINIEFTLGGGVVDAVILCSQVKDYLEKDLGLEDKGDIAKSVADGLLSLYNAASDTDSIKATTSTPISPFVASVNLPYGGLSVNVEYNVTSGKIDYMSLSKTINTGLGLDTENIPYIADALLPVKVGASVEFSKSKKRTIAYYLCGTTPIIGFVRDICGSFADMSDFNKEELAAFVKKLNKSEQIPSLVKLAQVALENKIAASGATPTGAFDSVAQKAGAECIELNRKFNKVFSDETNFTASDVKKYEETINKLAKSKNFSETVDNLTDDDWILMKVVFSVWKKAHDAYAEMDKVHKDKVINFFHEPQGKAIKITDLQRGPSQKQPSAGHQITRSN